MSAAYPNAVKSFSTKQDFVDTVDAADPNSVQDEVVAIEAILGVNPHQSTAPASTDTFLATATTFANLVARLANIEKGIVGDAHSQYLRNVGGSTVTSSAVGVVGLTFRALAAQTAAFAEGYASNGTTLLWRVSANGDASFKAVTATSVTAASIIGNAVPIAFHISGITTTGVKIAKFIAPVPLTVKGAYAVSGVGSHTYVIRVNNAAIASAPTPATGTTVVYADYPDTNINAGDRVQIEVLSTSSGEDLSVTVDAVTR